MRLEGIYQIPAPRQNVWRSLLDPSVLKQAIPGCQELLEEAAGTYRVRLVVAAGLINGVFEGQVRIEGAQPPERLRLLTNATGLAGALSGWADVELKEAGGATELHYRGEMQASGLVGALGDRMLERLFRRSLDSFFAALTV